MVSSRGISGCLFGLWRAADPSEGIVGGSQMAACEGVSEERHEKDRKTGRQPRKPADRMDVPPFAAGRDMLHARWCYLLRLLISILLECTCMFFYCSFSFIIPSTSLDLPIFIFFRFQSLLSLSHCLLICPICLYFGSCPVPFYSALLFSKLLFPCISVSPSLSSSFLVFLCFSLPPPLSLSLVASARVDYYPSCICRSAHHYCPLPVSSWLLTGKPQLDFFPSEFMCRLCNFFSVETVLPAAPYLSETPPQRRLNAFYALLSRNLSSFDHRSGKKRLM